MPDTPTSGQVVLPRGGDVNPMLPPEANQMDTSVQPYQAPSLANRIVPASPLPTVPPQTGQPGAQPTATPAHDESSRPHLMGRLTGSLMRGLSGEHTEYTVDPNTGATVPTTVKEKPGQVFRSILAYGLMGGQGIGPKEGEQTFAQGLLAGLGSGMRTATEGKEKLDAQRRAQAQQQFENQMRSKQEEREKQKLSMEETLNNAAVASYAQKKIMDDFTIAKLYDDKRLSAINHMIAKDAPDVKMAVDANMKPLVINGREEIPWTEYQKLLEDNNSDIGRQVHAHTLQALVVSSGAEVRPDGYLDYPAMVSLYPVETTFTETSLKELENSGIGKEDPYYKYVEERIGKPVSPRDVAQLHAQVDKNWDHRKTISDITFKEAEGLHAKAEADKSNIDTQIAQLTSKQQQSASLGRDLFDSLNSSEGIVLPGGQSDISKEVPALKNSQYDAWVVKYANENGVPLDLARAMISVGENAQLDPNVVNKRSGATGLTQLMPLTAKDMGVTDIKDPEQNIMGGMKYLGKQLRDFGGNIPLALAAYNAGPTKIIDNQIPNFKETKDYIARISAALGVDESGGRKVTSPPDGKGGWNFNQYNNKEKNALRDFVGVYQDTVQKQYDTLAGVMAKEIEATPQEKAQAQEYLKTMGSLQNVLNSLDGTRNIPQSRPQNPVAVMLDKYSGKLANDGPSDVFKAVVSKTIMQGTGLAEALEELNKIQFPNPEDKIAVGSAIASFAAEYKPLASASQDAQQKASDQIQKASYSAYVKEHPELNPATASFPPIP